MLKDNWIDKIDNIDYIYAEDVNSIAHAVIDAEDEIEKLKESGEELPEGSVKEKNIANGAVTRSKIALGAIDASRFGEEIMPVFVPEGDESETRNLDVYTSNGVYFFNGFEKINTPEGLSYSPFYLFVSIEGHLGNQVILCGNEQPSLWGRAYNTGEWSEWQKLEGGEALTEGSVHTEHIADDAVTGDKIGEKVITSKHLANGAVEGGAIKTLAITETRIRDGAVTTPKIANGAITSTKIGNGQILIEHFGFDSVSGSLHETLMSNGYTGSWADMIATLVHVLNANHIDGDGGGGLEPPNDYE